MNMSGYHRLNTNKLTARNKKFLRQMTIKGLFCAFVAPTLLLSFGPAQAADSSSKFKVLGKVSRIVSGQRVILASQERLLEGEKLALLSKDTEGGVYGFVEVEEAISFAKKNEKPNEKTNEKSLKSNEKPTEKSNEKLLNTYEASLDVLHKTQIVQIGDQIARVDLSTTEENYKANTSLLIKKSTQSISSKYKPLVTQGLLIGETAETLWQDEFFVNYLGQVQYGIYSWMSVGTIVPANAVGAPNGQFKFRLYDSQVAVVSMGLNFTKIPNSDESTANVTFMWDSISNQSLISHNYITLAVVSFKNAQDSAALKTIGTSSVQTGYEYLFDNWNRILFGPNYNFENRKVGGYISFIKIWDRFHLQASLNTTNIESFKISAKDGYYPFVDMYWRY
jgi:hypothetical protein